ncbi:hypothetical protein HDU67_005673 [Dinochytrium kinnereticum]|nr:hypothetical protein HDU67_005673 [Dinochytrium kinnereticum]
MSTRVLPQQRRETRIAIARSVKAAPLLPTFLAHHTQLLKHIRYLDAPGHDVTDAVLMEALPALPNLTHLSLSGCWDLTRDAMIHSIPTCCPNLITLDLSNTLAMSSEIVCILSKCPNIVNLNLQSCPRMTGGGLLRIANMIQSKVKVMAFGACHHLTTRVAGKLLQSLGKAPSLRLLDVRSNMTISFESLKELCDGRLEMMKARNGQIPMLSVNVSDCELITKRDVVEVLEIGANIKLVANPVIRDHTPEGIAEYLRMIVDAQRVNNGIA